MLTAAGETATIEATTTDPVTRLPRPGGFWILTPTGALELQTGPDGHRVVTGVEPGVVLGWNRPRTALPGATLHLDYQGEPTMGTTPDWAVAGFVVRAGTGEPIEGAQVSITNTGAGLSETLTTDANGRYSRAGAPLGEYQVAATTPDGLVSKETVTFNADDDGGLRLIDLEMVSADDSGVITTISPVPGGFVQSPHVVVAGVVDLPLATDHVLSAVGWIDGAWNDAWQATYDPDGRHFTVEFDTTATSGPANLVVEVLSSRDRLRTVLVPVTVDRQPVVWELNLSPSSLVGGADGTGSVVLSEPAPPRGSVVHLSSSNPAVVSVPETVTVPEGQTTAAFAFTTFLTTLPTTVQISAATAGVVRSASILVDCHPVASLALMPPTILGGVTGSGTVTLNAPAPPGGFTVAVTSSMPQIAAVPATLVVPEGNTEATFQISTVYGQSTGTAEITASGGGATVSAILVGQALGPAEVGFPNNPLLGGSNTSGWVRLNAGAPPGGIDVALSTRIHRSSRFRPRCLCRRERCLQASP